MILKPLFIKRNRARLIGFIKEFVLLLVYIIKSILSILLTSVTILK
jgi:hypothetical protein